MKFEKNTKYNTYALLAVIVIAVAALIVSLLVNLGAVGAFVLRMLRILAPLIYAFIIILVILPIAEFFERSFQRLSKKAKKHTALSNVCAYILLFSALALSVAIIIGQASTFAKFTADFAKYYIPVINNIIAGIEADDGIIGEVVKNLLGSFKDTLTSSIPEISNLATAVAGFFGKLVSQISDWIIALIISAYIISRKEKLSAILKRVNAALFNEKASGKVAEVCGSLYRNLVAFLSARVYNVVVVAVVYYFVLLALGLKFHSIICLLIAACSIVPVVGTLIGGGLATVIVLVTDTKITIWFVLIFIVFMVLDYRFLRPLITKRNVQVSLGTTLFCVLFGYFIYGILGALFAVPIYITARDFFFKWHRARKQKRAINSAE